MLTWVDELSVTICRLPFWLVIEVMEGTSLFSSSSRERTRRRLSFIGICPSGNMDAVANPFARLSRLLTSRDTCLQASRRGILRFAGPGTSPIVFIQVHHSDRYAENRKKKKVALLRFVRIVDGKLEPLS